MCKIIEFNITDIQKKCQQTGEFMLIEQTFTIISNFIGIYKAVVPKDNILREIKELVCFDFVYEELRTEHFLDNSSDAIAPIVMFKCLLLKFIYDISDLDVVERFRYICTLTIF